jgi:hypothetical protein
MSAFLFQFFLIYRFLCLLFNKFYFYIGIAKDNIAGIAVFVGGGVQFQTKLPCIENTWV